MKWPIVRKILGWALAATFVAGIAGLGVLFYVQAPRPLPTNEVIGHWEAAPEGRGTADFYADGTFSFNGLSMDILTGYDAAGGVSAHGTWTVRGSDPYLTMEFLDYEDRENDLIESPGENYSFTTLTLGWGKHRQLYFSDVEERNLFRMNRVSDEPTEANRPHE